ncbi:unnamed protein product [Rodentolepis nana]|uniref:Prostatic spermine-binding protein-like n=1 Tax=Rodentolepis nana TaxID=102285 RepID=A0A0R3TXK6_RODNA|nr:unnamed protein product [Rodentolepis nana]
MWQNWETERGSGDFSNDSVTENGTTDDDGGNGSNDYEDSENETICSEDDECDYDTDYSEAECDFLMAVNMTFNDISNVPNFLQVIINIERVVSLKHLISLILMKI